MPDQDFDWCNFSTAYANHSCSLKPGVRWWTALSVCHLNCGQMVSDLANHRNSQFSILNCTVTQCHVVNTTFLWNNGRMMAYWATSCVLDCTKTMTANNLNFTARRAIISLSSEAEMKSSATSCRLPICARSVSPFPAIGERFYSILLPVKVVVRSVTYLQRVPLRKSCNHYRHEIRSHGAYWPLTTSYIPEMTSLCQL